MVSFTPDGVIRITGGVVKNNLMAQYLADMTQSIFNCQKAGVEFWQEQGKLHNVAKWFGLMLSIKS